MKNLCYFCHYHRGDVKEKTIKIAGSFLIAAALFTWGFSASTAAAFEEYLEIAGELLPESAMPQTPPPDQPPSPAPSPEEEAAREQFEREREAQEIGRWKNDRLREWRDQLREVGQVRRQIVRLKGSQDEVGKLDALKTRITQCQTQLTAATDTEAMKDVLEGEECGETGEIWEELNRIRQAVEIPKELNRLLLSIKRLEKTAAQKWAKKIADLGPVVAAMKEAHGAAKAAYQAGEFEDAQEVIRDNFHEKGDPGECQGALHMIRGFMEPLRQVRDKDLKSELEGLVTPVKEALVQGECREAREAAEAIERELGPQIFKLIFDSQRRKRALPDDLFDRIERVRQKLEQQEAAETVPSVAAPAPAGPEGAPAQPVQ